MIDAASKTWSVSFVRAMSSRNKDAIDRVMVQWQYAYRDALLELLREISIRKFRKFGAESGELLDSKRAVRLMREVMYRENSRLGFHLAIKGYIKRT